jgi:glycosyltransferase involved in cell wall biosynthesis
MIIVDDCSSDNTADVVKELADIDPRIKYYCLEQNSGAAIARTEAMKRASGQYMAFCDSDDLWYPDKLEKQLKFMEDNNYNFTCTAYSQIDESNHPLDRIIKTVKKIKSRNC